jgi:hypothetical protein
MNLVKSKQRVTDHGEVFTPAWMVEAMLALVKEETERIDARFLEPACGSGNFIGRILQRKLAAVELKYGRSDFEPTLAKATPPYRAVSHVLMTNTLHGDALTVRSREAAGSSARASTRDRRHRCFEGSGSPNPKRP